MSKPQINNELANVKKVIKQSGFPFENDIGRILLEAAGNFPWPGGRLNQPRSWDIERDFLFRVKDAEANLTIRSIDYFAWFSVPSKVVPIHVQAENAESVRVTFLIDAKYSENAAWIFVPDPNHGGKVLLPHLLPAEKYSHKEYKRDDLYSLALGREEWPWASTGRKVNLDGNAKSDSVERETLAGFQTQMMQAVLEELKHLLQEWESLPDSPHCAHFFIPIIVTNAQIFLAEQDISLKKVESAGSIEEICKRVNTVCLAQPNIADIVEQAINLTLSVGGLRRENAKLYGGYPLGPTLFTNSESLPEILDHFLGMLKSVNDS